MGSEMVGMNEMDAIWSFGDAVEWAIRSESASELGALSPARSFGSLVDSAIRSSDGSATDSIPSSPSRSTHNALKHKELFLPLPVPVLRWDTKLAMPLPLPPSGTKSRRGSQQAQQVILFSDLERLNRIGNGSVYKVVHKRSGQVYALTVIYGQQEEWIKIRQQVHRELQIARNVDHPNVVKFHQICDENNHEIQVLVEFMDRGSMEGRHISNELQLADLSRKILRGLAYLHRRHIVHSDINPSNILINSRNQVKIADFVVGRILNQITMDPCNSSLGKIAHMSPERINMEISDGQYEAYAGDIWSFGVTILELYMGKFPFGVSRDGDWASLMCVISLCQPPQPPSYASFYFTHFIDKCLQRDPSHRWSASRLLQHPFITQIDHGSYSPKQIEVK